MSSESSKEAHDASGHTSKSSFGSQSQCLPSSSSSSSGSSQSATIPIDNTDVEYEADDDSVDLKSDSWGILTPLDQEHYRTFSLKEDITYKFGRTPTKCHYTFMKRRDHFWDTEDNKKLYSNLSKVHFTIQKQIDLESELGFTVYITDCSTNGTFINGELIGKMNSRPLMMGSKIAIAKSENEAFIFINIREEEKEREELPKEFRKKYTLENVKLGSGATGVVRRGYVKNSDKKVAVKILTKGKTLSVIRDLTYEASLMRQINHKYVVKVEDIFENDKAVYIVLEYIAAGELFDYVREKGAIPEQRCKIWMQQLLEAVDYLHGKDIIHRDLKPENVLMTSKDEDSCEMKITDFGLSRFMAEQSLMNTLVGTPNYLAPEVFNVDRGYSKGYGRLVDCWSLGCILFVMLSGYQPFTGEDEVSLREKIKTGSYEMDENIWESVSEKAKDLVNKMLTVSPRERITIQDALMHEWFTETSSKKRKLEE